MLRIPEGDRARRRRAAAVRRHHDVLARCATGTPAPASSVAVVGLGGLGHMAVKIAHAMGAEVTVLSQSLTQAGRRPAPRRRPLLRNERRPTFRELAAPLRPHHQHGERRRSTSTRYLRLLAPRRHDGQRRRAAAEPLSINVFSLIGSRRSFAGSPIGGIRETQEMLDFCAEHGLGADDRDDRRRRDQRGVRARAGVRRPLPLRDRREHDRLIASGTGWMSTTGGS